MATLVLGAVGAGLGFLAGGPAGAQLGFNIGAIVGGVLFAPHQTVERGKLTDLRVTGSGYGGLIPSVYGVMKLGGNLIWATDLVQHVHSSGGKGGPTVRDYTYTCSFAVSVCRGPVSSVKRIWAEDLLVYDTSRGTPSPYDVRVYTGDEAQVPDALIQAAVGADLCPAYRGQCYVVFENLPLANWGNRIPAMAFEVDAGAATGGSVLADLAGQCGMEEGTDYDFSSFVEVVEGYTQVQRTSAYAVAEELLAVFAYDMAEIDGVLVAVRRGDDAVADLTVDDLGAHEWSPEEDPPPVVSLTRKSDLSLPFRMDLSYVSLDRLYEIATQGDIRHSRQQVQDSKTLSVNLAMHDTDARKVASMLLDQEWSERTDYAIELGPKHLELAPLAPVSLQAGGRAQRVRLTQLDMTSFGNVSAQAVQDGAGGRADGRGYVPQHVTAGYVPPGGTGQSAGVVPSSFDAYSGLEFRDEDGLHPGFYVVATGGDGWQGGTIYYSTDGSNWTNAGPTAGRADFGLTTEALPDYSTPDGLDIVSSLGVQLVPNGSLSTTSLPDVVNGANAALVGLEIAGYVFADPDTDPLSYNVSNIVRGRRGSPMTGHASVERFWHLNAAVARVNVADSLIGEIVHVKVLSPGQSISDVTAVDVVIAGNNSPFMTTADQCILVPMSNSDPDAPSVLFDAETGAIIFTELDSCPT